LTNNHDNFPYGLAEGDQSPNLDASLLAVALPRWRCRPDGNQRWLRLELSPSLASALRRRASAAGLGLDAWLGLALAVQAARVDLGAERLIAIRRRLPFEPITRASDRRLRAWQDHLVRCDSAALRDELPEVVLPVAISDEAARAGIAASPTVSGAEWELARRCELRATGLGRSLPDYIRQLATV
jgi:hypothetical protein